jgi:hypothetical protein
VIVNVVGAPLVAARGRRLARTTSFAAQLIAGRELSAHAASAWRRVSGIAMIAVIAVGGSGASLVALRRRRRADGSQAVLFADMRTGVLVTPGVGFCSPARWGDTGRVHARGPRAHRGPDRLGMPGANCAAPARSPSSCRCDGRRWGALVGVALALPVVG